MDAQGLAANLIQNTVILSTAVELGVRWRELAERLGRLSSAQIAAYETPHRGKNGEVSAQVSPPHNSLEAFPETTWLMIQVPLCVFLSRTGVGMYHLVNM